MLICICPIGALWDYPFINLSIFLGRFLNPDLLTSFNFYILSSPLVPMVVFLGLAAWLPGWLAVWLAVWLTAGWLASSLVN